MPEPDRPERPHLDNSRPLNWTRVAHDAAAGDAVAHLLWQLEDAEQRTRSRRAADRERLRATMEAVVLDLYVSAKDDPAQFLAYSRRKADYGEAGEHPKASLTSVTKAVDFLESAGYATTRPGSFARRKNPFGGPDYGTGYRSRVRAEPLLVDTLEGMFGVTLSSVGASKEIAGRPVRLKAPAKKRGARNEYVRFKATPETEAMARRIGNANRLRASCSFSFAGERPKGLHLGNVHLHRLFNNGSWRQGGRFYGGWWEQLPKPQRARILINGETTVELDYSAIHPRLCYAMEGIAFPPDRDPYVLEGLDPGIYRPAVKRTFAMLLHTKDGCNPKRPAEFKSLFPTREDYLAFISRIEAGFAPVAGWLRAERGLELQWMDSEIADEVMARLAEKGVACLPVHDSFIVPASDEEQLRTIMDEAYRSVVLRLTGVACIPHITRTGGGG